MCLPIAYIISIVLEFGRLRRLGEHAGYVGSQHGEVPRWSQTDLVRVARHVRRLHLLLATEPWWQFLAV